jgi:dUTP pyrophosphatase
VELKNFSSEPYEVNRGDRIAQLVVLPVVEVQVAVVADVKQTSRGDGGFGSTGS